jgi:Secretion system C-terminal sorting domain
MKLSLSGSAPFKLGDFNLAMNFNSNALSNPTLISNTLTPVYTPATVKNPAVGLAVVDAEFRGTLGQGLPIGTLPTEIAVVQFTILNTALTTGFSVNPANCVVFNDAIVLLSIGSGCPSLDVPLPLEWLDFRATAKTERGAKIVNLDWVTASERNIQYFVVERSQDGKSFVQVGANVTASNKSTKNAYHVEDSNPLAGLSFYRIHEATLGGKNSYSPVRSVDIVKEKGLLSVYPNPSDSDISIEMEINKNAGDVFVEIFDLVGKQVYFKKITAETERITIPIPTINLPNGNYVIRVKNGANIWQHKIVKN